MSKGQDAKPARPGPRTAEGLARCRAAPWKHGRRAAEMREAARLRGEARRLLAKLVATCNGEAVGAQR
jgi:hypothetical protein